jgi:flavin-binding protein dodecin
MAEGSSQPRTPEGTHLTRTAKIVEIVGTSPDGFQQAVEAAVADARETTRNLTGAEIQNLSVTCDDGLPQEYKASLKLSFGIERTDGR